MICQCIHHHPLPTPTICPLLPMRVFLYFLFLCANVVSVMVPPRWFHVLYVLQTCHLKKIKTGRMQQLTTKNPGEKGPNPGDFRYSPFKPKMSPKLMLLMHKMDVNLIMLLILIQNLNMIKSVHIPLGAIQWYFSLLNRPFNSKISTKFMHLRHEMVVYLTGEKGRLPGRKESLPGRPGETG